MDKRSVPDEPASIMEVRIRESKVSYASDYPHGWSFSAGDYFKFPVTLKGTDCFIKRFEKKSPESISGWELLLSLKGKKTPNLPRIYDIQECTENGKKVLYVFYEYIKGVTLDKVNSLSNANLHRLTDDLLKAFVSVHERQFWFADFIEKNIFLDTTGRFLLIDLDSTYPVAEMPGNVMYGSKEFWSYVLRFYQTQMHKPDMSIGQIYGPSLNCLMLIFLVVKYKWKLEHKGKPWDPKEDTAIGQLASRFPLAKVLFTQVERNGNLLPDVDTITKTKDIPGRGGRSLCQTRSQFTGQT
jgi:hypothetical protein